MRILFVCHRFPFPPNRGGKIRPFNIISHLHHSGHDVDVVSISRNSAETADASGISAHCRHFYVHQVNPLMAWMRMLLRLPTLTPSSMGYFYSPEMKNTVSGLLEQNNYDLIVVHCSSAAQYVEDVRDIPKVMDFGDMDSQKWLIYARTRAFPLKLGYYWEGKKMLRAEKSLARKFDLSTCTTRMELDTLLGFHAADRSAWFPNGVNLDFFQPAEEPYDPNLLCFVGRMDYYPNQDAMFKFCRDVMPIIQAQRPETKLQIVGANPSKAVLSLAKLQGITVTGSVEDVRPFAQRSAVSVAPLNIARGTQNKILESMAMGLPVVASPEACKGVDAVPGEHLLEASSPQEYASEVFALLDSPKRRNEIGLAGRKRALACHNWPASLLRLDGLIDDLLNPNVRFRE